MEILSLTKNIIGDFELDRLENPILNKNEEGKLVDIQGRLVNQKGYFVDSRGNIIDLKGTKIFSPLDIDEEGEIPKVFRAGVMRKDTQDSFLNLMKDIEELEKETSETDNINGPQHMIQQSIKFFTQQQTDQIQEEEKEEDDGLENYYENKQQQRRLLNQKVDKFSYEDVPSTDYQTRDQFPTINNKIDPQEVIEIESQEKLIHAQLQTSQTNQQIAQQQNFEDEDISIIKTKNRKQSTGLQGKQKNQNKMDIEQYTKGFQKFIKGPQISQAQTLFSTSKIDNNIEIQPQNNQYNKNVEQFSYGIGGSKDSKAIEQSHEYLNSQSTIAKNKADRRLDKLTLFQQVGKRITEKLSFDGTDNDTNILTIGNQELGVIKDPIEQNSINNRVQELTYNQMYQKQNKDEEFEYTAFGKIESNLDRESTQSRQSTMNMKQQKMNSLQLKSLEGSFLQKIDPSSNNKPIKIKKPIKMNKFRINDYDRDEQMHDRNDLENILDSPRQIQEYNNEESKTIKQPEKQLHNQRNHFDY